MNTPHYISVTCGRGTKVNEAHKVELSDAMTFLCSPQNASPTKEDSVLIFNGYSSTNNEYLRNESCVDVFSTIFIDCDNPTKNKHIIEDFKKAMENYNYLLYETFSSTPDQPKFRAIIPIDGVLKWSKNAKNAIFSIFSKFVDDKASWFFSPTLNKIHTIVDNDVGREFPASVIIDRINTLKINEQMETTKRMLNKLKYNTTTTQHNPEGWKNLPSVKKCLEGLSQGERDNALNAACFAMNKNGYREYIQEFLMYVDVPNDMKQKFRLKYK